jgi:hypothetical protein
MIELRAQASSVPPMRSLVVTLAAMFALASPLPAHAAGVLCGTVRDAATHQPIARAGIFVRTIAGAYTGFYAASDALGKFCIGGIPAGTYDVEVRVDEYLWTYVRNVVVNESTTDVGDALVPRLALLPPSPNPARRGVHLRFGLAAVGPATLEVLDASGRLIKGWSAASLSAGAHDIPWDLRDGAERSIPAGRYFVRLSANDRREIRSFVRIP